MHVQEPLPVTVDPDPLDCWAGESTTSALRALAVRLLTKDECGPVFTPHHHIVHRHRVRNRVERWIQELKRRIDTFYASFTGNDVSTTNNWLKQFAWTWNVC